jgi:preprotein translocase subunit SecA
MVEKSILLQVLDQLWKEHIATLDQMRHTIVLRAYGQKDPLNEYKKEAFNMFSYMLDKLKEQVTFILCRTTIQNDALEKIEENRRPQVLRENRTDGEGDVGANAPFQYSKEKADPKDPRTWGKVARNDACPCGSGKKYKHCHGQLG